MRSRSRGLKKARNIIIAVFLIIAVIIGSVGYYVSDYYRADLGAVSAFIGESDIEYEYEDGNIVIDPGDATCGFVFYPGGKVEAEAYIPLMHQLAKWGVFCVICPMPLRLAVLDVGAANGITSAYPNIEDWYIGGHSLGGSMAAQYIKTHDEYNEFRGLVLLASYSTADLSDADISVLSIYGTEDGVLNMEKYEKYRSNLPSDFTELTVDGGNHAYFGMYGDQKGDGEAMLTPAQQIEYTAAAISYFFD